jgi:hypothetical protein
VVGQLVTLDERENRLDTSTRVDVAEGLETISDRQAVDPSDLGLDG